MSLVSYSSQSRTPISRSPESSAGPSTATAAASAAQEPRAGDSFTTTAAASQSAPQLALVSGGQAMPTGTAAGRQALSRWEAPRTRSTSELESGDSTPSCSDEDSDTGDVGDTEDIEDPDSPGGDPDEIDDPGPQEGEDCVDDVDESDFDPADDEITGMEDEDVEDVEDEEDTEETDDEAIRVGRRDNKEEIEEEMKRREIAKSERAKAVAQSATAACDPGTDSPAGPGQEVRNLKRGDRGDDVTALQDRLRDLGYFKEDSTGYYGPKTEAAVREFQRDHGIEPIGKAGPKTRAALACASPDDPKLGDSEKQVPVPFISQFGKKKDGSWLFPPTKEHPGGPKTACFRACKAMLKRQGVRPGGPTQDWPGGVDKHGKKIPWTFINVAKKEGTDGHITPNPKKLGAARNYIDSELDKGRPVLVGISNRLTGYNGNTGGHTDHYIVITGRGIDPKTGESYYTFNDPGQRNAERGGSDNPANRLYVDPETGNLVRPQLNPVTGKPITGKHPDYELSEVRRNLPYDPPKK